jgi:hypothetical protein
MPDGNGDRFDGVWSFWLNRISRNGGQWKQRNNKGQKYSHHERLLDNGIRRKEKGPEVSLQPLLIFV